LGEWDTFETDQWIYWQFFYHHLLITEGIIHSQSIVNAAPLLHKEKGPGVEVAFASKGPGVEVAFASKGPGVEVALPT
jgi:hypothetical protein